MMKLVCLVWCTPLLVKVTGWSALGFFSLTMVEQGWLSGRLADRLWYIEEELLALCRCVMFYLALKSAKQQK